MFLLSCLCLRQSLCRNVSLLVSKFTNHVQTNTVYTLFGPTSEDVTQNLDLRNKTCLITGGTSGIGLEILRILTARGCNIVMGCRNKYTAKRVIDTYCKQNKENIHIHDLNLTSLKSVRMCTDKIIEEKQKFDIVILNAAVFGLPWSLTEDGMEITFQVNYLSQIYLLLNIRKCLETNARVVFVSTSSHRNVNLNIQNPYNLTLDHVCLNKNQYTSIKAYNLSKLSGVLAMNYLNRKWHTSNITLYCAAPGTFIKTGLCQNWWPYEVLYTIMKPFSKSISQAASTPLICATSQEAIGAGGYWSRGRRCVESELASDELMACVLYDLTKELIAVRTA